MHLLTYSGTCGDEKKGIGTRLAKDSVRDSSSASNYRPSRLSPQVLIKVKGWRNNCGSMASTGAVIEIKYFFCSPPHPPTATTSSCQLSEFRLHFIRPRNHSYGLNFRLCRFQCDYYPEFNTSCCYYCCCCCSCRVMDGVINEAGLQVEIQAHTLHGMIIFIIAGI